MHDNNPCIIDFHSHILPGIDDGSESNEMSLEMLRSSYNKGVDIILATPHYYNYEQSVNDFAIKRTKSFESLSEFLKGHENEIPKIRLASEVRIYPELSKEENLDLLCIENTKNILIEMPYKSWSDWMFSEIYGVKARGYNPIMAHVERFAKYIDEKEIFKKLLSMDVRVQCNANSFMVFSSRRFIKKLASNDYLTVIGSDAHNTDDRKTNIDLACKYIEKKYNKEYLKYLMENAKELIE